MEATSRRRLGDSSEPLTEVLDLLASRAAITPSQRERIVEYHESNADIWADRELRTLCEYTRRWVSMSLKEG